MATVRRVPRSPFWIAKYRDGDTIKFRSTKQKNRSKALEIALGWERLAKQANDGEATQAAVLKFANDLLERVGQGTVGKISTKDFAMDWLTRGVKSDSTRKRYESVINTFLEFLGPKRAGATIASITAQELERFRDEEMKKGKLGSTADFNFKVLRAMMESAKRSNQRLDNPADAVESLTVHQQERKPFSDEQLLVLLRLAEDEWRGMILFGAFGGIRLNDAANIRWDQINLEEGSLTFVPAKTARKKPKPITVALHGNILKYLKTLTPEKSEVGGPVFPSLAGKKSGSAGGLSNQFNELMIASGLRKGGQPKGGKEDGAKRKPGQNKGLRSFHELSFHSTRHYFISKLANADVPVEVRKAMAGHSADEAHKKYVHLELETQKRAILKLPDLTVKTA